MTTTSPRRASGIASRRVLSSIVLAAVGCIPAAEARAQPAVNTTATRQALDESFNGCDGVSVIVRRCASPPVEPAPPPSNDPLTRSRAAAKAAFDRRDKRARDAALAPGAAPPAASDATGVQRLGGVTVTGAAVEKRSVEEVLQQALNPQAAGVPGPNGTVSYYAPDGARFDCIAKCIGPACCATVRSLPNPARESNSIGR